MRGSRASRRATISVLLTYMLLLYQPLLKKGLSCERTTIEAFAAVLKHGADIGALPPRFDVENAAQYLYVITSGFSTLVAQNADVDAVAVWNKAVDLLLLDAKRQ